MNERDLRMIGWIGFQPAEKYEVKRDEMWTYYTTTEKVEKDENGYEVFNVRLHLKRPEKCIASRNNAHP